ncbi:hypothetical protein ACWGJ7_38205, partial [Streptomyces tendae]
MATTPPPPHGSLEFYVATSAVIPLLLLAYFFSANALGYVTRLRAQGKENPLLILLSGIGLLAPVAGVTGAVTGETASLIALYTGDPSPTNAFYAVAGLITFVTTGFIHLIIVLCMRVLDPDSEPTSGRRG